jgi:dienelactone hydrolase
MAAAWENIKVDGSDMRAYVSAPTEFAKVPGIVVVQGQSGVDDFVEFSNMVAGRGSVAVAPDMFHLTAKMMGRRGTAACVMPRLFRTSTLRLPI